MRTTAIVNLKGGVGKTTTAINMAAILAKRGQRVLLVDADSQCNTTEFFQVEAKKTITDLLRTPVQTGFPEQIEEYVYPTEYAGLELLPADDDLMGLDISLVRQKDVFIYSLRILLLSCPERYDYVIIDCPPAFNAACAAGLIAADDVVIPIKLDAFSLKGMINLKRQINSMKQFNGMLKVAGVLPTMWYSNDRNEEAIRLLKKNRWRIFHHIRRSDPVDAMTWEQAPVTVVSPRSGAAVDYRRFVREYLGEAATAMDQLVETMAEGSSPHPSDLRSATFPQGKACAGGGDGDV